MVNSNADENPPLINRCALSAKQIELSLALPGRFGSLGSMFQVWLANLPLR